MDELNRLLSTDQAARMLGIHRNAMKMRAYRGTIPTIKYKGHYRYKLADLVECIDNSEDEQPIEPPSTTPGEETISLFEAADILQMPKQTLWSRIKAGLNPRPIGKVDGKWRYRMKDVLSARKELDIKMKYQKPVNVKPKTTPARHDLNYGIQFETITAICPKCHVKHEQFVVKGSTKWIYCSKHACYRNASRSRFEPNNVNLPGLSAY